MSRNPKEALDAGARHLREALTYSQPDRLQDPAGVSLRTTVTIRPELHALRVLAATRECRLNDLLVVAIEDLLVQQGVLPGAVSRPALGASGRTSRASVPTDCRSTGRLDRGLGGKEIDGLERAANDI
jgi:hypothetical protein